MSKHTKLSFECQQSGHCCCDPNIIVTLTFLDVYNLFLELDRDFESVIKNLTFYRFTKKTNHRQMEKLVLPTISTSDGEVIPGLKKINGMNCTFYTKPNCSIYSKRPLACKNYPFTFLDIPSDQGFYWAKGAEKSCPGIGKGNLVDKKYIEISRKITNDTISIHQDLIQELNTEAIKGKPLTVREIIWIFIAYGEKMKDQIYDNDS